MSNLRISAELIMKLVSIADTTDSLMLAGSGYRRGDQFQFLRYLQPTSTQYLQMSLDSLAH